MCREALISAVTSGTPETWAQSADPWHSAGGFSSRVCEVSSGTSWKDNGNYYSVFSIKAILRNSQIRKVHFSGLS